MINKVKIYNRFNIEMFINSGGINFPYREYPWYLISIHTSDDDLLTPENKTILEEMGCKSAISLRFGDITDKQLAEMKPSHRDKLVNDKNITLFNTEQAKTVIGFLLYCSQDEQQGVLIAHCDAGVSRSGAIGTFAVDFFNLDYQEFTKENPHVRPNYYVLRLLRNAAGFKPLTLAELNERDAENKTIQDKETQQKIKEGGIFLP